MRTNASKGFTAVELLVALAVLGILVALAAPSFSRMFAQQRLRGMSNELRSAVSLARSEAVKRNSSAALRGLGGSSNWTSGWEVAVTEVSGNVAVMSEYAPASQVAIASGPSGGTLLFSSLGRPTFGASTCAQFQLETTSSNGTCSVCLSVLSTGKVVAKSKDCSTCPSADSDVAPWQGACP